MDPEAGFLAALTADPTDDNARMAYADLLDDRGDDASRRKAHFLRVTVRLAGPIRRAGWRLRRQGELRDLAADLPAEWLAVVSRVPVERCGAPDVPPNVAVSAEALAAGLFNFVCDRRWDQMAPTAAPGVRRCERCQKDVHFCDSIDAARLKARSGLCVALSVAVPRRGGDLDVSPAMVVGGAGGIL